MQYTLATLLAAAAAVNALPAAVTSQIAPAGAAPSGCMPTYSGTFGIQVTNMTAGAAPQVSESADGQPEQPTAPAVSQISDGQPQATTAVAVSQISDGQPQQTTGVAVSQISDGQPQATGQAVSQISDGQPQQPTGMAVSQISDGQPQATGAAASQVADGQPQASGTASSSDVVACASASTLTLTLSGGILTDSKGRTGYIAANDQFQFDGPPQAGAIYTAGWSVCANGSLALGGDTTFYQCLSGDFYNLYNTNQGAQCNPVSISVLQLVDCSS